jgi:hypothetical protein
MRVVHVFNACGPQAINLGNKGSNPFVAPLFSGGISKKNKDVTKVTTLVI